MNVRPAVALLLTIPALALGACGGGGGSDDSAQIKDLINKVAKSSVYGCDHATTKLLKTLGGSVSACKKGLKGAEKGAIKGDIAVKVSGATATADFTTLKGDKRHVTLVKQSGDWKIDTIAA